MSNMTIENVDISNVVIFGDFEDGELYFSAADTVLAGTILARDSISLKYVPFVKGGTTNENGIPKAILTVDVTATAAGDVAIRALIAGTVRQDKLIIDADGTGINIDAVVLDQLRDYAIIANKVDEQLILDNQ